jgi:D-3-phosphoglycerate dehydrogenase / 2-oxoglutarate reductase
VFNTPGANANAVKELVLASMLLAARDVVSGVEWVHTIESDLAKEVEKGKKQFAGIEIKGKTLGIIGLGAIGILVANAAANLGMKVIGYDLDISVHNAILLDTSVSLRNSIEGMLPECDYVTIHIPSNPKTNGLMDKKMFAAMKPGTRLLNFSRDKIVNEDDLEDAINAGIVKRYVTDFPNERVFGMKNVICIPHLGASTAEAEENCAIMAVEQMKDYLENGNIRNSVNYPTCYMGACHTVGRIAILNKNVPAMLVQITNAISTLNISEMSNKSKDDYAYTLIDVDAPIDRQVILNLAAIDGVIAVRVIK